MLDTAQRTDFAELNRAYGQVFRPQKLTVGLVVPMENYAIGAAPSMENHVETAQLAEELGFTGLWVRDIPFDVPNFGDVGQMHDPFVYLSYLAAKTSTIALGAASIVLPLRHPAHVAKSAASIDQLSGGRLLLGVASGDRPDEYPAMALEYGARGEAFRESFDYIRQMGETRPRFTNQFGDLFGQLDMLPKPHGARIPLLVTGGSQQNRSWIADKADGWMVYPQAPGQQMQALADWRSDVARHGEYAKPVMHPLYIDLLAEEGMQAQPLHLGIRSDAGTLRQFLRAVQASGVNHVALNLRFNRAPVEQTLRRLAAEVLPEFTES